jgi:phospholipid/cholesterol/gamma-HCH transport system ATP-binding protein
MIEVKNINKSFDDRQVLYDITARFDKGKTNLIIGQSGSGKTVLLKSIIGLRTPETGEILYDGRNSLLMDSRQIKELRKEIGMLFQGAALFDSETVLGNVMYPLRMHTNMTYRDCKKRAEFCLDRVNLHGANNLYPSEISGGMQKRVAIARAIALNPKYLFCDEPNSGLDPMTSVVIDKLIQEITKEYDMTTIINTHDMNSVMEIGEKIVFIYEGNKWWEGSNQDILHSDNQELNDFVFASAMAKRAKGNIVK